MIIYWVDEHSLNSRIDAEFYRPDFVANERRIRAAGVCLPLDELRRPDRPITNGIRGPELADTNYRMLRLQDVDGLWIDSSRSLRVSHAQFQANRRAWCTPGDILLAIGGYIGVVGKVADDTPQTMGQHAARLSFDTQKVDPDFMLAFLSSPPGTMLCQRYVSGGVQAGINLEDVREIHVLVPSQKAQRAIGNKLRKAERLREISNLAREATRITLSGLLPSLSNPPLTLGYWAKRQQLSSRLDPNFYRPDFIAVERKLRRHFGRLRSLADLIRRARNGLDLREFVEAGTPYLRVADVDPYDSDPTSAAKVAFSLANVPEQQRTIPGDVLVTRKGSFGTSVVVDQVLAQAIISSEVIRLELYPDVNPYALSAFLNCPHGRLQLERSASGTTMMGLTRESFDTVLVPSLQDKK